MKFTDMLLVVTGAYLSVDISYETIIDIINAKYIPHLLAHALFAISCAYVVDDIRMKNGWF